MATKRKNAEETTETTQEVDVLEPVEGPAPPVPDCGCCTDEPPYVPVKLRGKLEKTAIKMLNQLEDYPGEYNDGQLKIISSALEIYRVIKS